MFVNPQVKIQLVQFAGDDGVMLVVEPQLIDEKGTVVGRSGIENVFLSQKDLTAAAKARGADTWGDADIIAAVKAARLPDHTESVPDPASDDLAFKLVTVPGGLRFPDATITF